jgi:hypothetical protein
MRASSGERRAEKDCPTTCGIDSSSRPSSVLRNLIFPSLPHVTIRSPFAEKETELTPTCPGSVSNARPLPASQTRVFPSLWPAAM